MKLIKYPGLSLLLIISLLFGFISCGNDDEPNSPSQTPIAEEFAGNYSGTLVVTVSDEYHYSTDVEIVVKSTSDNMLSVSIPEYSLENTMMGDLTIGAVTIDNVQYVSDKKIFFRDYGGAGLTQHFKASKNGVTTIDSDFPLNSGSSITLSHPADGSIGSISFTNPFQLGKMPFSLSAYFYGFKRR